LQYPQYYGYCKREDYAGCGETIDSELATQFYGHYPCAIFGCA